MRAVKLAGGFQWLDSFEGKLCVPCNDFARLPGVAAYFRAASRLGDGVAWYVMLILLPILFGPAAIAPTVHMSLTALVGVGLYKILKSQFVRERPFASHNRVQAVSAPLDRYSFPSGHTLHAVCFLVMWGHYFPTLMWILLPFGISVAISRVVLGLHYPSDVAAGALIGWLLATGSLAVVGPTGI